MITRRQLLLGLGTTAVAALPIGLLASSEAGAISAVVRKRLDYLQLDANGVDAFAQELAQRRLITSSKLRLAAASGLIYVDFSDSNRFAQGLRRGEDHIVSYYLLSSDFFTHGADESRLVSYTGFYDPLASVCRNPFAVPLLDAAAPAGPGLSS